MVDIDVNVTICGKETAEEVLPTVRIDDLIFTELSVFIRED